MKKSYICPTRLGGMEGNKMELFDTHAHYNDEKFKQDRDEIIKQTYEAGITKLVCAGYNLKSSREAIDIANKNEFIYAICGISPNDLEDYCEENLRQLKELAKHKKNVAIGEIGLDYHYSKENKDKQIYRDLFDGIDYKLKVIGTDIINAF